MESVLNKFWNTFVVDNRWQFASTVIEHLTGISKLPRLHQLITYDQAIQYFVDERPPDRRVRKGAILRQPDVQGWVFVQVFLDRKNQLLSNADGVIYGRQLIVGQLDQELLDAFGTNNVVFVE